MTQVSATQVKEFVISYLRTQLEPSGRTLERELPDTIDLLEKGLIDSLGVFNLTVELEQHFGCEIDFGELDPEEMMILGPLCRYVASVLMQKGHQS